MGGALLDQLWEKKLSPEALPGGGRLARPGSWFWIARAGGQKVTIRTDQRPCGTAVPRPRNFFAPAYENLRNGLSHRRNRAGDGGLREKDERTIRCPNPRNRHRIPTLKASTKTARARARRCIRTVRT